MPGFNLACLHSQFLATSKAKHSSRICFNISRELISLNNFTIFINEDFTPRLVLLSVIITLENIMIYDKNCLLELFRSVSTHFQFLFVFSTFGKCFMLFDLKHIRVYLSAFHFRHLCTQGTHVYVHYLALAGGNSLKLRLKLLTFYRLLYKHAFLLQNFKQILI